VSARADRPPLIEQSQSPVSIGFRELPPSSKTGHVVTARAHGVGAADVQERIEVSICRLCGPELRRLSLVEEIL